MIKITDDILEKGNNYISNFMGSEILDYHASWDLLIPAIKKCYHLAESEKEYEKCCQIKSGIEWLEMELTWLAVFDFTALYKERINSAIAS